MEQLKCEKVVESTRIPMRCLFGWVTVKHEAECEVGNEMEMKFGLKTGLMSATALVGASQAAQADMEGSYGGVSVGAYNGFLPFYDDDYIFANDVVFGAFVGQNWAVGSNMLAGVELSLTGGAAAIDPAYGPDDQYTVRFMVDVKARVGTMIGDKTFAYGFAGVSGGILDADDVYGLFGANFGVGAEFAVSDSMRVGLEYTGRSLTAHDVTETSGSVALRGIFSF